MSNQNNNHSGNNPKVFNNVKTQDSPLALTKNVNTIKTTPKPKPKN